MAFEFCANLKHHAFITYKVDLSKTNFILEIFTLYLQIHDIIITRLNAIEIVSWYWTKCYNLPEMHNIATLKSKLLS